MLSFINFKSSKLEVGYKYLQELNMEKEILALIVLLKAWNFKLCLEKVEK